MPHGMMIPLDVLIGYNNAVRFYDAEMSAYRISTGELL